MDIKSSRKLIEKPIQIEGISEEDLNSWDFHYQKIKQSLDGCEEEKQAIIRRRILRYFGQFKLESQNFFSIRLNLPATCGPLLSLITNRLLLYGIDYLSIQRAKQYFQGYIIDVKRVDDSHFLVEFRNQIQCFNALYQKMVVNLNGDLINLTRLTDQIKFNNPHQIFAYGDFGWVEIQPYKEFIFERKLMARYLTNYDKIEQKSTGARTSVYYAYSQAKRKFIKSLKQSLINKNNKVNQDYQRNWRQRSRSKQKGRCNAFIDDNRCSIHPFPRQQIILNHNHCHGYRQCCCQCNCQTLNRRRDGRPRSPRRSVSQKNSSVQSRRSSVSDGKNTLNYNKEHLTILQQQRIDDSDFKFDLYIKNRDKKKKQFQQQQQSVPVPVPVPEVIQISNPFCNMPSKNNLKNAANNPFITSPEPNINNNNNNSVIMNPKLSYPDNQISISGIINPQNAENLESNPNNDSMNFQMYLQRLKLEDNSQQFSVFDIEATDQ